jgi:hypothetical protein
MLKSEYALTHSVCQLASRNEARLVEKRISDALNASGDWEVVAIERRPIDEADAPLAERLLRGPRASV